VELEEAAVEYDAEEGENILEKLFKAGKIEASELGINIDEEKKIDWSRRIHALERIADRVPVYNRCFNVLISYTAFMLAIY